MTQPQKEVRSPVPEKEVRIQGMIEALELQATSLKQGVRQCEVQGRAVPGWTTARRKEILDLELETSKLMLHIEDYAKT